MTQTLGYYVMIVQVSGLRYVTRNPIAWPFQYQKVE